MLIFVLIIENSKTFSNAPKEETLESFEREENEPRGEYYHPRGKYVPRGAPKEAPPRGRV